MEKQCGKGEKVKYCPADLTFRYSDDSPHKAPEKATVNGIDI